jgi:hypothetical protein
VEDVAAAVYVSSTATAMAALMGQREVARTLVAKIEVLAEQARPDDLVMEGHRNIAHFFLELYGGDDPWAALRRAEAARLAFTEAGHASTAMCAQCYGAQARMRLGDLEGAARDLGAVPGEGLSMVSAVRDDVRMRLFVAQGRFDEARAMVEERFSAARAAGGAAEALFEVSGRPVLGELALLAGDPAQADREIVAGLDAGLRRAVNHLPAALAVLAEARLALGRPAEALADAKEAMDAMAVAGTLGFRDALVRLAYAEALHANGKQDEARAAIADAAQRLHTIAGRIADPDLQRSYLEAIPEHTRTLALAREWLIRAR